jgi:hypothetical protein
MAVLMSAGGGGAGSEHVRHQQGGGVGADDQSTQLRWREGQKRIQVRQQYIMLSISYTEKGHLFTEVRPVYWNHLIMATCRLSF